MRKPLLALLLLASLAPFLCVSPASAAGAVRAYYAGPAGSVRTALGLAENIEVVADPAQADVFVFNGVIPDLKGIASRVRQGAGLVLILGPNMTPNEVGALLDIEVRLEKRDDPLSLNDADGVNDPVLSAIVWTSAPQVRERFILRGLSASVPSAPLQGSSGVASYKPLVVGFEDGSAVLVSGVNGAGRVFVLTSFLDTSNLQFQDWAYFNYLVYHLATRAAGQTPLLFADYPGSPVPHEDERIVLYAGMGVLVLASIIVFVRVRRYSLAHPEALDSLVANREEFAAREAGTDWEAIGFHRPLGGFLVALMLGLVLFVPLIIYQNLILPDYILPSAQALGIWGRVVQFFNLLWLFFDMGTSAAFVKFFAQYRVRDPRRGIQYGQVFVWWQALSGAVQVAMVIALAGTVLPRTTYALYAWSIIVHSFIQLPGFYQVMKHALSGLQRSDYAQIVDLCWAAIFPIITQPILVLLMLSWGQSHPVFGASMGGLLGLGLAAYATEALTFVLGLWLYRRLGYNARVLFLAHFDWSIVKDSFRFGVFEMLGSIAWGAGQSIEVLITQTRLVNYAEIWGNWGIAQNFIFAFQVLSALFNNVMPGISEAISHGRRTLSTYYATMSYKWGGLISAFIGSVLLAVADRFILGATGPEFVRAAVYAVPLIIWGAIQYPSWVSDAVQLAANRPYLKAASVAGEQVIRVVLALLLVERLQINGLIIAYFVGLLAKDFGTYVINHRLCFPHRFYAWQSLIAPLLAGAAHYLVLRWITGFIWRGDQVSSVLIFFVGILLSFPLFVFFYGLFGGWDEATLGELKRAVDLSSFMQPLARLFWAATALGARYSPLHGRFPIGIRQAALDEARSLTEERVTL